MIQGHGRIDVSRWTTEGRFFSSDSNSGPRLQEGLYIGDESRL